MVTEYITKFGKKQHLIIPAESELDIVFKLWVVHYDVIHYKSFAAN